MRDAGFAPVVRAPGGGQWPTPGKPWSSTTSSPTRLAVADGGPVPLRGALWSRRAARARVDARVGEVPGEYCPGSHSVNARGRVKVVGTAQRMVRRVAVQRGAGARRRRMLAAGRHGVRHAGPALRRRVARVGRRGGPRPVAGPGRGGGAGGVRRPGRVSPTRGCPQPCSPRRRGCATPTRCDGRPCGVPVRVRPGGPALDRDEPPLPS